MSWIELFFGFHGRIGRKTFWVASIPPTVVQVLAWAGYGNFPVPPPVLAFSAGVAAFAMAMLNTKRLHDVGKSGWWQIISLLSLPLIAGAYAALYQDSPVLALMLSLAATVFSLWGLWILFEMWFKQGHTDDNRFGAAPKIENVEQRLNDEISQMQPTTARLALINMPPPSGVIDRKAKVAARMSRESGFGRRDARSA
ncbi:MAG: DUF805 domain-containing protein [Hyphomicrobium sp.]